MRAHRPLQATTFAYSFRFCHGFLARCVRWLDPPRLRTHAHTHTHTQNTHTHTHTHTHTTKCSRWTIAMARLCMAKGALTEDDLDRELGIPAARPGLNLRAS
jgi:hypothetical protein